MILIVIFAVSALGIGALSHVPVLGVIAGIVITGAYYRYDVKRHPKVACRVCGGSGDKVSRVGGGLLRRPRGACGHCGGKKGFPRPALRVIDGGQRKKILSDIERARQARKNQ